MDILFFPEDSSLFAILVSQSLLADSNIEMKVVVRLFYRWTWSTEDYKGYVLGDRSLGWLDSMLFS